MLSHVLKPHLMCKCRKCEMMHLLADSVTSVCRLSACVCVCVSGWSVWKIAAVLEYHPISLREAGAHTHTHSLDASYKIKCCGWWITGWSIVYSPAASENLVVVCVCVCGRHSLEHHEDQKSRCKAEVHRWVMCFQYHEYERINS